MSIVFPSDSYIRPQPNAIRPSLPYTGFLAQNLLDSMDSTYAASANILFHEFRDESLVSDYDTDVKRENYPWYNNSFDSLEDNERRYDCRLYAVPYWPPNPYPGDDSNVSSSSSRLAVRARGRNAVLTVCMRQITSVDSNGIVTVSSGITNGSTVVLTLGSASSFGEDADILEFPTGIDRDTLQYPFLIEAYWCPFYEASSEFQVPGWLSALTIIEYCASDFPS